MCGGRKTSFRTLSCHPNGLQHWSKWAYFVEKLFLD